MFPIENDIVEFLNDKVLETGVTKMILEFKKDMEYEEFIKSYDNLWYIISQHPDLPEDFIRRYRHNVYWRFIFSTQSLSDEFLQECIDKKYFNIHHKAFIRDICKHQKLSDEFISSYRDLVDWKYISRYQSLSKYIKMTFSEYLNDKKKQ